MIMNLHIEQLGPVKELDMDLGSLTVISGASGVGKSFICRALYAVTNRNVSLHKEFLGAERNAVIEVTPLNHISNSVLIDGRHSLKECLQHPKTEVDIPERIVHLLEESSEGQNIFSVLYTLLSNETLSRNSLLIFDVAEANLDSYERLKLAEVLAMMVKDVGIRVVAVTVSIDMAVALEAYFSKEGLKNADSIFYLLEEDGALNTNRNTLHQGLAAAQSRAYFMLDKYKGTEPMSVV